MSAFQITTQEMEFFDARATQLRILMFLSGIVEVLILKQRVEEVSNISHLILKFRKSPSLAKTTKKE